MKQKVVIITGATKGIGKAIALKLAAQGIQLILNYHSDHRSAEITLNECRVFHPDVHLFPADVSRSEDVKRMIDFTVDTFKTLDAVINNAGKNIDKPLLELSESDWDTVVNTNMKGVFLVSRAAAGLMLKQESGGHIINIGATTAIRGRKNGINYCASKAGVLVMTKCLALELGPKIRVNCVIPGFTRTEEIEERFDLPKRMDIELEKRKIPLQRIGNPAEIANVIYFLLSPEASYINGQKIIVDGGEFMY
ncbi:MAG TPA: SDR family NAD(P)-dependent oxidoreductase [Candidatus Deferrimicrobium sp.]|nr:SDR family NAD(P)-dependent oxidoreductase [Candidatus Deferrimicrobium sp.]